MDTKHDHIEDTLELTLENEELPDEIQEAVLLVSERPDLLKAINDSYDNLMAFFESDNRFSSLAASLKQDQREIKEIRFYVVWCRTHGYVGQYRYGPELGELMERHSRTPGSHSFYTTREDPIP